MRSIGWRLPILAITILTLSFNRARGQEVLYLETADWIPTASALAVPTSYLTAAYVLPTSYAVPTVYATAYLTESALLEPTTYLTPTYYETRFRRRGLFGRRLVETSRAYYIPTTAYYPTTYYFPTVFRSSRVVDTAVLPTVYATSMSTACCGEMIASTGVRDVAVATEPSRPAARPAPSAPRRERTPVRSESAEDESIPSNVPELPARERGTGAEPGAQPAAEAAKPQQDDIQSPPAPQLPNRREQSTVRPTPPASGLSRPATQGQGGTGAGGGAPARDRTQSQPASPASETDKPPVAPSDSGDLFPAPEEQPATQGGRQTRESQRPVLTTPRTLRPELRNILFGRVRARDTDEPEEGVRVTVSNRRDPSESREGRTDAFGRFAVRVPDGDWNVNVTMPSGRVYSVSRINVTGGQITDEIGRDVPSLVITR